MFMCDHISKANEVYQQHVKKEQL